MATELRYPKGHVFFDGNAAAAALGTLEWFEAGTTTNQNAFADKDENTALPNPLTLDSAGRATDSGGSLVAVYFSDAGQDYKEVLKDGDAATIYTDDNIPKPVDPTAGLSDFAKPLTEWSTDTSSSVTLSTSDLGAGRLADTSSNNITYNLPSASNAGNGKSIVIKKTSGSNSVTVDGDGSETIDGSATFSWTEDDRAYRFTSDGANWQVEISYLAQINSGDVDAASDTAAGVQENAVQSEMESASSTTLNVVPGRVHYHPAVAKAWGFVSVSGGTPSLDESYNVSSITDAGTGQLTVNVDTDFSSTTYAVVIGIDKDGDELGIVRNSSRAVGSFRIDTFNPADQTARDPDGYNFAAFGDQ